MSGTEIINLVYFVHWELKGGTFVMGSKPHTLRAGGLESCRHRRMALVINIATARSPLRANPPSKSTVKAQFFGEQAARVSRQATRYALYCEATDNIDSSIKFQKFRSASPSFSKDGCTNRVKSVLRLAQRQNKLTLQFSTHR